MIRFFCPYCREINSVSDDIEGGECVCSSCNKKIPVPNKDDWSRLLPDKSITKRNHEQTSNEGISVKFYKYFEKFLDVRFDELTVFIMSSSFLFLLCTNQILRQEIYKFYLLVYDEMLSGKVGKEYVGNIVILTILSFALLLPFIIGIVISIIHVFTDREKGGWTKYFMFSFAWMMSLLGGVVAGFLMLLKAYMRDLWFLTIFPIINLGNTFLLLIKLDLLYGNRRLWGLPRKSVEYSIKDDNATKAEVLVASAVNIIVIIIAQYVFKFHWSITFSICNVYAINFCNTWRKLFR